MGEKFVDLAEAVIVLCYDDVKRSGAMAEINAHQWFYVILWCQADEVDTPGCVIDIGKRKCSDTETLRGLQQFFGRLHAIIEAVESVSVKHVIAGGERAVWAARRSTDSNRPWYRET